MLQRSVRMAGLALLALILSACQLTQTPDSSEVPSLARIAAKGEWSLHSLTAPNRSDTSQLRYRISLRITSQEFSVAAPCARLLGHYRATEQDLRFRRIETRDISCTDHSDAQLMQALLQHTRSYRVQDEQMLWLDQNQQTLAVWDRIYL